MVARDESWQPRARFRARDATVVAIAALALFGASWALLHVGFYSRHQVIDTPIYQRYGDAMEEGQVPYRDFRFEYPPGALPMIVLPSLNSDKGDLDGYERTFGALMWLCGAAALAFLVVALNALRAGPERVLAAVGFAAVSPLLVGSLLLTRFDLWPAALTVGALAALVAGRERLGFAGLGLAVATKVYPGVIVPLAAAYVWRRHGRREALLGLGIFAAVVVAVFVPFLAIAPGGVVDSVRGQLSRPLQIESLGAAVLLAAHQFGLGVTEETSHGSQNLAGPAADTLATVLSVAQALVLLGIWVWFARGPADRERLVRAAAAAVCAFIAFGKVLSPQYLVWLVPLVPLVRGRRGVAASGVLAAALLLTQGWFPYRYWELAREFQAGPTWFLVARDLVLVARVAVLLWPVTRERAEPRTT